MSRRPTPPRSGARRDAQAAARRDLTDASAVDPAGGNGTAASDGSRGAQASDASAPGRRGGDQSAAPRSPTGPASGAPTKAAVDPTAVLRAMRPPEFEATVLAEPQLVFGHHQRLVDPKTGLGLHGPFDLTDPGRPAHVRVGLIGTGPMLDRTRAWIERCRDRVTPFRRKGRTREVVAMDPTVYTTFPGTAEVFATEFVVPDALVATLRDKDVYEMTQLRYYEDRVTRLVDLLVERLRVLSDKATPPDVVIVALPAEVRKLCTVASRHLRRPASAGAGSAGGAVSDAAPGVAAGGSRRRGRGTLGAKLDALGQLGLFGGPAAGDTGAAAAPPAAGSEAGVGDGRPPGAGAEAAADHLTLHHALKARAMEIGLRTQLLWEETLEGTAVQDDATRAWNFWTALYYKAGGIPWRASGLAQGTCFVGVGFYRDRRGGAYRTCMAQAFSDEGEGFVLRSDPFKWDRLDSPHLTREVADELMSRVLEEYEAHLQHAPRRVVVHKWSRYWDDERAGFEEAVERAGVHAVDLVAFGDRDVRFFRAGAFPPLRNTLIQLGRGNALLYTQGYTPFSREYGGMRVPRPLEIVEHFGSASMTQIAQEILTLTKLDYNTTAFAGRQPITTAFSQEIGHILAELPGGAVPKTRYWFYM